MPNDEEKWEGPATGSEVARGLLQARLASIELYNMIANTRSGNDVGFRTAAARYVEIDLELKAIINEVGGLEG